MNVGIWNDAPAVSFLGNICFEFSVQCLCSVMICCILTTYTVHQFGRITTALTSDKYASRLSIHCKKRFMSFPSPAGMSLTKLPLGRNNSVMTSLFPPRESLVVTSRLGTGNSRTFFYGVLWCFSSLGYCQIIHDYFTNIPDPWRSSRKLEEHVVGLLFCFLFSANRYMLFKPLYSIFFHYFIIIFHI